jgi:hypothetical protein
VPRLMEPAIRSGCHSAATLAAVSDGAFTRVEVPQMVHRPGSQILLTHSLPPTGRSPAMRHRSRPTPCPDSTSPYGQGPSQCLVFDPRSRVPGFRLVAVTLSGPNEDHEARVRTIQLALLRDIEITKVKPWWLVITGACS